MTLQLREREKVKNNPPSYLTNKYKQPTPAVFTLGKTNLPKLPRTDFKCLLCGIIRTCLKKHMAQNVMKVMQVKSKRSGLKYLEHLLVFFWHNKESYRKMM